MEQKSNVVCEIRNDAFYAKKNQEKQFLSFAYLHLAEKADETFLALFENAEAQTPLVYWWEDSDVDVRQKARRVIIEFIGEAYMSLYISRNLVKPIDIALIDMPIWVEARCKNSIIPAIWQDIVDGINQGDYGSQKNN